MTLERIRQSDKKFIIGIDEVGTGSLAGKIYVVAFLAPKDWTFVGVKDSKAFSSQNKRKEVAIRLMNETRADGNIVYCCVSVHPNSDIYKDYGSNMHSALKFLYWKAASRIIEATKKDALIILDGNIKFPEFPHSLGESVSLPKADALIPQVSAASVIGKAVRDEYMTELGKKYPEYNWAKNKGYPSPDHLGALTKYGYCDEHRFGYEPIKSMRC